MPIHDIRSSGFRRRATLMTCFRRPRQPRRAWRPRGRSETGRAAGCSFKPASETSVSRLPDTSIDVMKSRAPHQSWTNPAGSPSRLENATTNATPCVSTLTPPCSANAFRTPAYSTDASSRLWHLPRNGWLDEGLVDELTIIVPPVVLGGGKRLFEGFTKSLELEHIGVRQWPYATFIDYRVK
jgi:hypothetical protein